jgi:hypothetical protein
VVVCRRETHVENSEVSINRDTAPVQELDLVEGVSVRYELTIREVRKWFWQVKPNFLQGSACSLEVALAYQDIDVRTPPRRVVEVGQMGQCGPFEKQYPHAPERKAAYYRRELSVESDVFRPDQHANHAESVDHAIRNFAPTKRP